VRAGDHDGHDGHDGHDHDDHHDDHHDYDDGARSVEGAGPTARRWEAVD